MLRVVYAVADFIHNCVDRHGGVTVFKVKLIVIIRRCRLVAVLLVPDVLVHLAIVLILLVVVLLIPVLLVPVLLVVSVMVPVLVSVLVHNLLFAVPEIHVVALN